MFTSTRQPISLTKVSGEILRLLETIDIVLWELFLSVFICERSDVNIGKPFSTHHLYKRVNPLPKTASEP